MILEKDKNRWIEQILITMFKFEDLNGLKVMLSVEHQRELLNATIEAINNLENDLKTFGERFKNV